jgi:hypothetical protein
MTFLQTIISAHFRDNQGRQNNPVIGGIPHHFGKQLKGRGSDIFNSRPFVFAPFPLLFFIIAQQNPIKNDVYPFKAIFV